jgi:hypothetical protein
LDGLKNRGEVQYLLSIGRSSYRRLDPETCVFLIGQWYCELEDTCVTEFSGQAISGFAKARVEHFSSTPSTTVKPSI